MNFFNQTKSQLWYQLKVVSGVTNLPHQLNSKSATQNIIDALNQQF